MFDQSPTLLDLNRGLEALKRRSRMADSVGREDIAKAYTDRLLSIQRQLRMGCGQAAAALLQTPMKGY